MMLSQKLSVAYLASPNTLPRFTNQRPIENARLDVARWNTIHSSAMDWLGPFPVSLPTLQRFTNRRPISLAFPCFAEHLAVVCEPASDWGPSVGMHSTAPTQFSFPVCGPQNDGFRPRIRQLGRISFGNLARFHPAT